MFLHLFPTVNLPVTHDSYCLNRKDSIIIIIRCICPNHDCFNNFLNSFQFLISNHMKRHLNIGKMRDRRCHISSGNARFSSFSSSSFHVLRERVHNRMYVWAAVYTQTYNIHDESHKNWGCIHLYYTRFTNTWRIDLVVYERSLQKTRNHRCSSAIYSVQIVECVVRTIYSFKQSVYSV